MLEILPIPYQADNSALFSRLQKLPGAVWLDSQGLAEGADIISALPSSHYYQSAGRRHGDGDLATNWQGLAPFDAAKALFEQEKAKHPSTPALSELPFQGGIIGYWSYDAAPLSPQAAPGQMPEAAFGWYDWFIVAEHRSQKTQLVFLEGCAQATRDQVKQFISGAEQPEHFQLEQTFSAETSRKIYQQHIQRILDYIRAGDCYQVNYAQAFSATYTGSPWAAYKRLRQGSRSPYSAYLNTPFGQVLSLSPEQFLAVDQGRIQSQPIKGTRPRVAGDPVADAAQAQALLSSAKDRAENVMITDLLRNDLGQHAQTGSVRVDKLCELQSFSLVHHLVSTISARLQPGSHMLDLLRDAFPGGSITGAPKRRAMEIIAELEPTPRSVYCGSIGYISQHGRMDMNIAIRTLVCQDGRIRAWAGGGITADSKAGEEYQECLNKIGGILRTLEAMPRQEP